MDPPAQIQIGLQEAPRDGRLISKVDEYHENSVKGALTVSDVLHWHSQTIFLKWQTVYKLAPNTHGLFVEIHSGSSG